MKNRLNLDFTLITSTERKDYVDQFIINSGIVNFKEQELETMANYILYGKEEDGKSIVDKKEITIKTKYSSYNKKEPESLDALIESPTFNETVAFRQAATDKNRYRSLKQTIVRKDDQDIPEMHDLWTAIDKIAETLDVYNGKKTIDEVEDPVRKEIYRNKTLTAFEAYKIKHMLIDLRRQQFCLRDFYKPLKQPLMNKSVYMGGELDSSIPWGDGIYEIAPLGSYHREDLKFYSYKVALDHNLDANIPDYAYDANAPYILDFRNPEHIYIIYEHFTDLSIDIERDPALTTSEILDTLIFYTNLADLNEEQKLILSLKIKKYPNKQIQDILYKMMDITHTTNYISTIWKQKICPAIAAAAQLNYDEYINRHNSRAWKKCNYCGKMKLKDVRNFVRKARSNDGLSNKCKKCDRQERLRNKRLLESTTLAQTLEGE